MKLCLAFLIWSSMNTQSPPFSLLYHEKKITATLYQDYGYPLAQEEGFEPPCLLGKRFSRPPRYDHFDIPAYLIVYISYVRTSLAPPRYVLLRCPIKSSHPQMLNFFDRSHSFLLAFSATGSARKRPHFDIPAYLIVKPFTQYLTIITQSFSFVKY